MPKPTLLQSLLGRPSQTYTFPPDRQYYSSKHDLARTAASLVFSSTKSDAAAPLGHTEVGPLAAAERSTDGYHQNGMATVMVNRGSLSGVSSSNEDASLPFSPTPQHQITSDFNSSDSDDDSGDELFYTPFSSPPTSMLVDPPISFVPPDASPSHSPDDKSSSSSSSSSSASSTPSAISCSTPPTSEELHAAFAMLQKRPVSQSRSKRLSTPSKSYTYTDEDWAKEFRWLVQSPSSSSKRRTDLITHQPKPHRPRPRTVVGRPITSHRMTALLEEDEDVTDEHRTSTTPSHVRGTFPSSAPRPNSITRNSHDVRPPSQASHAHSRISYNSRTVELPQFPASSSPAPAPGRTALTLPRASYQPEDPWRSLGGGRVDLPRDGRAQISMVSIEVVRGAAASASFFSSGFRKRRSAPRPQRKHDLTGAIALSSHRPPPSFVPNSAVLVQVYAVGLEGLDGQILTDRLAASEAGGKDATTFVPGRGVLGRVVECGLEVSSETLKKGEWIVGLLDAKKCGGLCEFVLLDRRRLHRAPHPGIPLPVPARADSAPSFSLESLALLATLGVSAYRAVRTYTASRSPSLMSGGGTALILRGQDGAGGLATLMLRATGVNVVVQVDPSAVGYDAAVTTPSQPHMLFSASDDKALGTGIPRRLQEVCARLRTWGVEGICVGSPLAVLQTLDIDVDFVFDTIGGREIWDASRILLERGNVLRGPAQFTTIVGDAGSGKAVPTMQDHWRAGVRSLKRAMTIGRSSGRGLGRSSSQREARRNSMVTSASSPAAVSEATGTDSAVSTPSRAHARTVDYTWVSCVADIDFEGGDVRDALAALLAMPTLQHPSPDALLGLGGEYGAGRVLPFERAPEAFASAALEGGGSAVIRVVL